VNYLAHIFLSGPDRKVQVGNFIGDAVKGNSYNDYPPAFRRGILLHRAIDAFTDNDPEVREAVRALKPRFGRYSGALLDIFFDYLLASRFREYAGVGLRRFTRRFYLAMIRYRRWLPPRIRGIMWHFIGTGRLGKYATPQGIRESLEIMVRYHRMDISPGEAVRYLVEHEPELRAVFESFLARVKEFCRTFTLPA